MCGGAQCTECEGAVAKKTAELEAERKLVEDSIGSGSSSSSALKRSMVGGDQGGRRRVNKREIRSMRR